MNDVVRARAYANIALIKYWGKSDLRGNVPATPSISLTLDGLVTETEVRESEASEDIILINNVKPDQKTYSRIVEYGNLWRRLSDRKVAFFISTENRFPTKAGLASSASGYAALATALNVFLKTGLNSEQLSRLARQGSGSAARSIYGGLVALPLGEDPAAWQLIPPHQVPWGMVIAIVQTVEKEIGSREGMNLSKATSPYYSTWIETAKNDFQQMLNAIEHLDLEQVGELMEADTMTMHGCMIASRPSLLYWNNITVDLINKAHSLRCEGLQTYATIDAGSNVFFLVNLQEMVRLSEILEEHPGIQQVIVCKPGPGAELIR